MVSPFAPALKFKDQEVQGNFNTPSQSYKQGSSQFFAEENAPRISQTLSETHMRKDPPCQQTTKVQPGNLLHGFEFL